MKITVQSVLAIGSRTVLVIAKDENGKAIHFTSSSTWGWAVGQVRGVKATDLSNDPKYAGGDGTSRLLASVKPEKVQLTPEEEIASLERELAARKAAIAQGAKTAVAATGKKAA